jgi:GNAT superfamily N-acetyltransferase
MRPGSPGLPVGIVFRRLPIGIERQLARSLLAAGGPSWRAPGTGGRWTWFGLWDLAAAGGTGLLGTAAIRPVEPRVAELCALAVLATRPWRAVGDRLVREVADTLRADGAERVVARLAGDRRQGLELLRGAGFRPAGLQWPDVQAPGQDGADGLTVWLSLEL